jgi:hypothetical protein
MIHELCVDFSGNTDDCNCSASLSADFVDLKTKNLVVKGTHDIKCGYCLGYICSCNFRITETVAMVYKPHAPAALYSPETFFYFCLWYPFLLDAE